MKEYSMTSIAPTISKLLNVRSPNGSLDLAINEIVEDMGHQERLAVIVLDAFGVSTWKRFEELTPNFNSIARQNLLHVRSVLPAKTPVNFATMVTGVMPDVHRITDRTQPLTVETVFQVLSGSSMKSAAVGRAISTVGILLSKFADYKGIAISNTDREVLSLAIEIVENKTPEFILMQLLDVDDAGHGFGLESDNFKEAISGIDKHLEKLLPRLSNKGYAVIILADHGAHQLGERAVHDGSSKDDIIVPLTWRNV